MKMFTYILSQLLQENIKLTEEQQGFRKNRSTTDAIFILRQLIEKALEFNTPLYVCFMDMTQAFDRVRLTDVITALKEKGAQSKIIRLITLLNTGNRTKIQLQKRTSRTIQTNTGIRQGDSLSPILFNTIMDQIISTTKETPAGYKIGNTKLHCICYADDATLIADTEDGLQRMVHAFELKSKEYNMKISTTKTKCMVVSKIPLRAKIVINDKTIDQVMQFNYLGTRISSWGNLAEDIRHQANKAAKLSGCLRSMIWKNRNMSIPSKVRIYKACVRPTLTYAAETRADTALTKRTLRTTEMHTLRAISGFTLRDRKRNSEIRELCDVPDIVRWARNRRRLWNEHVERMGTERIARIVKEGKPEGKRHTGRPPKRWSESWTSISQEKLQENTSDPA
jgi:hypothetical protein